MADTIKFYTKKFQSHVPHERLDHHYLYAIVRKDLHMPAGKLAAQAGHAYTDALIYAQIHHPERFNAYRQDGTGGSKVTMQANNVTQLINAYELAIDANIPAILIVDQQHILPPYFDGSPIITALGIGPCTQDQSRFITKKFRCVK